MYLGIVDKNRFPFKNLESIVERRGRMVDFTCETFSQEKQLASALEKHKDVEFARLVE